MSRISYILRCIAGMDYKAMFSTVSSIHKKTGKKRIALFSDVVKCGLKYGCGYRDYELNEWWTLNSEQRKTYVTRGINNQIVAKLNDPEYYHLLDNKAEFLENFNRFVKRKWINTETCTEEEFRKFLDGLDTVVIKPMAESCGRGVEKLSVGDFESPNALLEHIRSAGSTLCEECIVQNAAISALYPHSVNTLRIVTVIGRDGKPHIVYAFIRIGNGGRVVDNINAGGMAAPIDLDSGIIKAVAFDKNSVYYEKHPETGADIVGAQIPMWNRAKDMVLEAAALVPQIGYVGWDVAVGANDVMLVEANQHPGHDILQMPPHVPDKIGMLPRFREFIDI